MYVCAVKTGRCRVGTSDSASLSTCALEVSLKRRAQTGLSHA